MTHAYKRKSGGKAMYYFKDGILSQPSALREVPSYATNNTGTRLRAPYCDCQGDGVCEACRAMDRKGWTQQTTTQGRKGVGNV